MKSLFGLSAAVLFLTVLHGYAQEQASSCIPLNETISICTDIDGLDVAIVGATETSVMSIVDVAAAENTSYGLWVFWDDDASLESVARKQKRDFAAEHGQYRFQDPVSVVVAGLPGLRYDMLGSSGGVQALPPKMLLFLDTGEGIAMIYGEAGQPDVSPGDLFSGAESAARILRKAD